MIKNFVRLEISSTLYFVIQYFIYLINLNRLGISAIPNNLIENFLLRGITESYDLKASCHEKIKEDKELSKLNSFLLSLCHLIN